MATVPAALPVNLAWSLLKLVEALCRSAPASCALPFGLVIHLAEDAGAAGRVAARAGEDVAASTIARGEPYAFGSARSHSVQPGRQCGL